MDTVTKFKMSQGTLDILKNFSTINSNLLIRVGSKIETLSPLRNLLASAVVNESFEQEFGVWDLDRFLGTVSLVDDPEFEFYDKHMYIVGSNGERVKFYYAEPKLLTTVNKNINMPDSVVSFDLKKEHQQQIQRASSVLQLPDLCIRSRDDVIEMVVLDKVDNTTNSYSIEVGNNDSGASFGFFYKTENLKMILGNYRVDISDKAISQFTNEDVDLKYWIALENDSHYED